MLQPIERRHLLNAAQHLRHLVPVAIHHRRAEPTDRYDDEEERTELCDLDGIDLDGDGEKARRVDRRVDRRHADLGGVDAAGRLGVDRADGQGLTQRLHRALQHELAAHALELVDGGGRKARRELRGFERRAQQRRRREARPLASRSRRNSRVNGVEECGGGGGGAAARVVAAVAVASPHELEQHRLDERPRFLAQLVANEAQRAREREERQRGVLAAPRRPRGAQHQLRRLGALDRAVELRSLRGEALEAVRARTARRAPRAAALHRADERVPRAPARHRRLHGAQLEQRLGGHRRGERAVVEVAPRQRALHRRPFVGAGGARSRRERRAREGAPREEQLRRDVARRSRLRRRTKMVGGASQTVSKIRVKCNGT
jgi:hypothetical protein